MHHADTCPLVFALDKVTADDAAWFERHPRRTVRIRPVTPAEQADAIYQTGGTLRAVGDVTVRQIAPGYRLRSFQWGYA